MDTPVPLKFETSSRSRAKTAAFVLLAALVGGAPVAAALAMQSYEILERGRLLSYTPGEVFRIRVFDRVDMYVEPALRPSGDILSGLLLVGLASMAASLFMLLRFRILAATRQGLEGFFLAVAGGASFLAADELFGFHETLGHNLRFLREIPGVTHPDDVIFAAYVVPALVFACVYRGLLVSSRRALRLFAAAFGLYLLAAGFDLANLPFDEIVEPVSAVTAVIGFIVLTIDEFSRIEVSANGAEGAKPLDRHAARESKAWRPRLQLALDD